MVENNNLKFPNLDGSKSNSDDNYMNIAKRNEILDKKYAKYKPRDSRVKIQNELKGEEGKLKYMLYSLIKCKKEENELSGNIELKSDEIFSSINKDFLDKKFPTMNINFDKKKDRLEFGSRKSFIKRKNNKTLKQGIKLSIMINIHE